MEWKKRIGDVVYIVEGPKYTHKRHQNQLQKRRLNHSNDVPQTEEGPIDTIFAMFDLDPPNQHLKNVGQGDKGNSPTRWWSTQKEKNTNSTFTKYKAWGCCGSLTHLTIMNSSHFY